MNSQSDSKKPKPESPPDQQPGHDPDSEPPRTAVPPDEKDPKRNRAPAEGR
jgi:hypothetical protein